MVGTRCTFQRIKILEYLKSVRTHPTAEEVFKVVKKTIPTITLATVYRNLNLLAREGTIQRLEIDHEYRYDAYAECHQHFVCEKSGKIYDIHDCEITDFIKGRIDKKKFDLKSINIIFRGVCKKSKEVI